MRREKAAKFGLTIAGLSLIVLLSASSIHTSAYAAPDLGVVAAAPTDRASEKEKPAGGSQSNAGGNAGNSQGGSSNASGGSQGSPKESNGSGGSASSGNSGSSNSKNDSGNPQSGQQSSGSKDESQKSIPPSGDKPGSGANASGGPFDPVVPSGPSENGMGGGNATHRPEAGQAGNSNADDKNPPGQVAKVEAGIQGGYECKNNGNGAGNPAHTASDCSGDTGEGDTGGGDGLAPGENQEGTPGGNNGENQGGNDGEVSGDDLDQTTPGDEDKGDDEQDKDDGDQAGPGDDDQKDRDLARTEDDPESGEDNTSTMSTERLTSNGLSVVSVSTAGGHPRLPMGPSVLASMPVIPEVAVSTPGDAPQSTPDRGSPSDQPVVLPYTGDAGESSALPALWAAAGLLFSMTGIAFRRAQPVGIKQ